MGDGKMIKRTEQLKTVRDTLSKMEDQFRMALPKMIPAERFVRIAITEISRNPRLLECSRRSLLGSLMESAQMGLEPGILGQAYLVPYGDVCTLIVGYKGLLSLVRRSGELSTFHAHVVYEKDDFDFAYGDEPFIKHKPSSDEDPGPMIGAYASAKLKDGGKQFVFMWKRQIDAIRDRSKASNNGPWVTDYEPMAKKTVAKQLCKWLPLTPEGQRMVELETQVESGMTQDLVTVDIQGEQEDADSTQLDALVGALEQADTTEMK